MPDVFTVFLNKDDEKKNDESILLKPSPTPPPPKNLSGIVGIQCHQCQDLTHILQRAGPGCSGINKIPV